MYQPLYSQLLPNPNSFSPHLICGLLFPFSQSSTRCDAHILLNLWWSSKLGPYPLRNETYPWAKKETSCLPLPTMLTHKLEQFLFALSQPLWAHMCTCPDVSSKHCYTVDIYCLCLIWTFCSLPLLHRDPPALEEGCDADTHLGLRMVLFLIFYRLTDWGSLC